MGGIIKFIHHLWSRRRISKVNKKLILVKNNIMYHRSLKYLSLAAGIAGLLSVNVAFADIQQLVSSPTMTVSPVTKPWPIGCYDFNGNMNHGMKGIAIRHLQYFLMKEGFDIPQQEFGVFGDATLNGVSGFQQKYASDILTPAGLARGSGFAGKKTLAKLNSLYSCSVMPVTQVIQSYSTTAAAPISIPQARLSVTNTTLDSTGVGATFCNKGTSDIPTAPFRIRLNGINRDFEVSGAQKAGACETDSIPYGTWGITYDPGSTYTAISIIDPNGYYKTSSTAFLVNATTTLVVPSIPGAHLSVRSVLIKTTGVQATLCNLGTSDLITFPVRVSVNGVGKDFDIGAVYKKGICVPVNWTYDNFGTSYMAGTAYTVSVQVDPNNVINETNEFDNTATAIGTP